jgi:uncharacterized protein (TIGR02757 family)
VDKTNSQLKNVLERLYARYSHHRLIPPDPLQFVYRYSDHSDMEIAGFLAAELAYGRVRQIEQSLTDLLARLGPSPYEFVRTFDSRKRAKLRSFKHRFTTGESISDLMTLLKNVLVRYGSIEKFFVQGYNPADENIIPALSKFCDSMLAMHEGKVARELSFLLSRPQAGSVCKRLNLFLRWMVRKDDVDSGIWKSVDKSKLIVPVDVHMGRLCKLLGLYLRKTISLSAAVEITDSFRCIEPSDPVKYDFALSRVGILESCTGRNRAGCEFCELFHFCSRR